MGKILSGIFVAVVGGVIVWYVTENLPGPDPYDNRPPSNPYEQPPPNPGGSGSNSAYCPRPYMVVASDGRCVWSCSQGTQPDPQTSQCVCQPGLFEVGQDQFGRRICS